MNILEQLFTEEKHKSISSYPGKKLAQFCLNKRLDIYLSKISGLAAGIDKLDWQIIIFLLTYEKKSSANRRTYKADCLYLFADQQKNKANHKHDPPFMKGKH